MRDGGPRVLMLATTLPGTPGDGTPEFVLNLARHTRPGQVTIIAPRVHGCDPDQTVDTVRLRRFRYAPRRFEYLADAAILPTLRTRRTSILQLPGLLFGMVWATFSEARRSRPDTIHAHWILPAGVVGALVARRERVPFVVTAHGADAYALNGRLARRLKRWVLQSADAVYPVSREIAERLDQIAPGCVTRVVPMGVDITALLTGVGERTPQQGRLLFVGRLADKKGVDVLLEAVALIEEPCSLTIVGDGPERELLEAKMHQLGLGDVRFLGHCTTTQVCSEYARASVVVIPSRTGRGGDRDGTPVVLMEAMALGIPVVASDLGGIGELMTDGVDAVLVPEGDARALAAGISAVLRGPDTALERADEARTTALTSLDVVEIGRDLAKDLAALTTPPARTPAAVST